MSTPPFAPPPDLSYLVAIESGVLRLTFNRPEFGNATPMSAVPHLATLFQTAQSDPAVRCIVVSGKGRHFSSGGDVVGFAKSLAQTAAERQADFGARLAILEDLVAAVVAFDRPIVASIRGAAAGAGLLYALAADYVIGDETAMFVFSHQRVALSPDGGVSTLLAQVVGARTARTLLLTATKLDANEACRLGILSRIVAPDALEAETATVAARFARAPQRATKAAKRLVNAAAVTPLADQLRAETAAIVACVGDDDFAEGVRAFIDKRPTNFPSAVDP